MRTVPIIAIALAAALAFPANALACEPTTSPADLTVDASVAGGPTYYVVDTCALVGFVTNHRLGCGDGGIYVYEESNGISGLQRGDEVVDNTCRGQIPSDRIVF